MIRAFSNCRPCHFPVLYLCISSLLFSQQGIDPNEVRVSTTAYFPRSQFTLKLQTNLVEVDVVVRDSRGHTVGGLGKDDFEIADGEKKREITAFSVVTSTPMVAPPATETKPALPQTDSSPRPRFVALLLDDYSMQPSQQVYVKAAARRFISQGLASGDRVALFTASGKQLVPFTAATAKLVEAIDGYNSFPRIPDGGICPKLTPYDAYVIANKIEPETLQIKVAEMARCTGSKQKVGGEKQIMVQAEAMWAQVYATSRATLMTIEDIVDYMGGLPGRRMILLASSGFLSGTLELEQEEVTRHALRSQVVINALDAKGLYAEGPMENFPGADPRSLTRMALLGTKEKDLSNDAMVTLAMSTGGLFFHNNNDLDLGFRELGAMPEVSYLLGFSPAEAPDRKYHGLKVRLKPRGRYTVQARPGYWALPIQQQERLAPERRVDREIMGSDTWEELPAIIASAPSRTDNGNPALQVVLHLDVKQFLFLTKDDVRTQKLTFIAALYDESANFIVGKENEIEFALKEATFNRIAENGLNISLTLEAPPGTYRLRAVAQDGHDSKLVAWTRRVEIH